MPDIQLNETLLDEKLSALESARSWSPRVISKLETLIRTGDDFSLFRVNPAQYAIEKGMTENEAIDLFLHATKIGLFEMDWHLVCPSCAHVVESFSQLSRLHSQFTCQSCYVDVEASLDDYIHVTFTLSPLIRRIQFHDPATLSAEDFFLKYHMSQEALAAEGMRVTEMFRGFTRLFTYIAPGEQLQVEVDLNPGLLHLQDYTKHPAVSFVVLPPRAEIRQPVRVRIASGRHFLLDRPAVPIDAPDGPFIHKAPYMGQLSSGMMALEIENEMSVPAPLWILNTPMTNPGSAAASVRTKSIRQKTADHANLSHAVPHRDASGR
jgi:hypothetical protein